MVYAQWRNYNFCPPPADIRYGPIVLIYNSGHFGPPYRFGPLAPPALPGLPMASFATVYAVVVCLSVFRSVCPSVCRKPPKPVLYRNRWTDRAGFLGTEAYSTRMYTPLCCKGIRVTAEIRLLAFATVSRAPLLWSTLTHAAPLFVCACQCC